MRPIRPSDHEALHAAFRRLSSESRYRRFLSPVKDLSESALTRLTDLDHRDHEALVAVTPDGELVGVARFIRLADRPDTAEVAVTIADEWQRRGVGTGLLTSLAARAAEVEVRRFVATCFADNLDMLAVFHDLPGARCAQTGPLAGVVEVELQLPAAGDHAHLARALKAGAGTFSRTRHPALPG